SEAAADDHGVGLPRSAIFRVGGDARLRKLVEPERPAVFGHLGCWSLVGACWLLVSGWRSHTSSCGGWAAPETPSLSSEMKILRGRGWAWTSAGMRMGTARSCFMAAHCTGRDSSDRRPAQRHRSPRSPRDVDELPVPLSRQERFLARRSPAIAARSTR